ncbi:hypothetical protein [Methylobacterium oryzihabitans]|uniref:Quinol:cytochrome c oxidoreductase quinone-binding subunit 2 n=1 Tax=Methylobacterium oryzihabitans TaxID=2499852 RepID=A0A3S2V7K9_9HYPH|nr:hypothetical protein [Methylobacterium oryzihabitans]RVU15812.1 hypothetical protein EOE48_18630 [Methylobacterium oryzihabitans]
MRRRPISLAAGLGALGLCALFAAWGWPVMPSYLAAWLVLIALPAGALPLLMGLEIAGLGAGPMAASLRRLLGLLPVAGLLLLPVLANLEPLYGWSRGEAPATPLAGSWFTPVFFWLRSLAYLAVWLWLAGTFRRPPGDPPDPRRRSRAMLGLGLHALVATLAAEDWVQSVDPGLGSTAFGLLMMTIQASLALSAAALIAARDSSGRPGRDGRTAAAFADPMLVLLAIWSFLHAVQYLVVWSANLPDEARWYLARGGPLGRFAAWTAVAVVVIAALALAPRRSAGRPAILAAVAGMIFALHGGELFWLVTPAFRGGFRFTLADGLALIGVVGVAAGLYAPVERRLRGGTS